LDEFLMDKYWCSISVKSLTSSRNNFKQDLKSAAAYAKGLDRWRFSANRTIKRMHAS
jgi:hypothetical protein